MKLPTEATPVWFMRQAGRYMSEYREVRKHHSLVEICKKPALAAEVTITAAEALGVDAAIIFADLLLPLEVMGLPFQFTAGEGPVIERPIREAADIRALRTDRAKDLMYVSEAVALVAKHFGERLPVIGFCGAPFTLASYMVEGGGSRNYIEVKKLMYRSPGLWDEMLAKLVDVLAEYAVERRFGAMTGVVQHLGNAALVVEPIEHERALDGDFGIDAAVDEEGAGAGHGGFPQPEEVVAANPNLVHAPGTVNGGVHQRRNTLLSQQAGIVLAASVVPALAGAAQSNILVRAIAVAILLRVDFIQVAPLDDLELNRAVGRGL